MTYYRVKPEYDNLARLRKCSHYLQHDGIYIQNELFTEKELEREKETHFFKVPPEKLFERVEVKKNTTYWFFGARFCEACGYSG